MSSVNVLKYHYLEGTCKARLNRERQAMQLGVFSRILGCVNI